jgi:heparan-alpha-glucosaminide N-acetyltransferase
MNRNVTSAPATSPTDTARIVAVPVTPGRLSSVDAYRGFVMFLMMAEVLRLSRVARAVPENAFWQFLGWHQSHVEWVGCSLHDLIQPSFSFLVGVALPFSIASRAARGQSQAAMTWHAIWRAVLLILLGVFLRSTGQSTTMTNWTFEDTLTQIGLGYAFLFVLGFRPMRDQWIALGVILAGYWALFAMYPLPGADFDYAKVGVTQAWLETHGFSGFAQHWQKNSNPAWAFDTWFMNLFPRERPFLFNRGGYSTLSFIPTLGTMILGLVAGNILRSSREPLGKIKWLAAAGIIGLVGGWGLGALGICPVVKRIWTPSWVLFSGGWCFLLLAAFYWVIDVAKVKGWAFPLVVVGMNSIAAYLIAHGPDTYIAKNLGTHFGGLFNVFGPVYQPLAQGAATLAVMWLILYWMYRRKLFLKI